MKKLFWLLLLVVPPLSAQTFQQICAQPGVVRCVSFDTPKDIAGVWGQPTGIVPGSSTSPVIDTSVFASGTGSMRFDIPSVSGQNAAGMYFANFSDNLATQFGANTEFYVQWRQRFTSSFITTNYGGNGWKQLIIAKGDVPGSTTPGCSDIEIATQNTYYREYAQAYNACISSSVNPAFTDFPVVAHVPFYANEWMTFQYHIKVGPKVNDVWTNSLVQLSVARQGQPGQFAINTPWSLTASKSNEMFGKVYITTYDTSKNGSSHPAASTWFDDLIISTQPISMTYGSGTNVVPPPTVVITSPVAVTLQTSLVQLTANAASSVGIASVQFMVDGVAVGSPITTAPYSMLWDITSVNGPHVITAVATDTQGNTTTSAPESVTVSTIQQLIAQ